MEYLSKDSAFVDYLTGMPNRRGLYDFFGNLPEEDKMVFMFIDIDNFKTVNDTYGHAVGDELLVSACKMLNSKIDGGFLARISGDEFVIILKDKYTRDKIATVADDILSSVEQMEISVEVSSIITFSIGIVMNQKKDMKIDSIMPKCDAAMYEAKRRGKNRYVFYDDIEYKFKEKQNFDIEKNQALVNGLFEVRYIPIMNITTTEVQCIKACVRMKRKDGYWDEDKIYSHTEDDAFAIIMERYVFEQVCKDISENRSEEIIPIVVTLSSIQLSVSILLEIVKKYGLSPHNFIILLRKISERSDSVKLRRFFNSLNGEGFTTAVGGFGKASSPIMAIKGLNINYVVIEDDILENLLENKRESLFVKNIMSLIKDLGYDPIVNGITNSKQAAYLATYGCNLGSGTLYSNDMSYQEQIEFASKNKLEKKKIRFRFDNTIVDETGKYAGSFAGKGKEQFTFDKELQRNVLYFPGGMLMENVIVLPEELMKILSYSIVIRFKAVAFNDWTSLFYVMYEDGFMSFVPYAWKGVEIFRVRDELNLEKWNDAVGDQVDKNWHVIVLTYNYRNGISRIYMDGECTAYKEGVPSLARAKKVVLGGDIYQRSFMGSVDELIVYDYEIDEEVIKEKYSK